MLLQLLAGEVGVVVVVFLFSVLPVGYKVFFVRSPAYCVFNGDIDVTTEVI